MLLKKKIREPEETDSVLQTRIHQWEHRSVFAAPHSYIKLPGTVELEVRAANPPSYQDMDPYIRNKTELNQIKDYKNI